MVKKMKQDIVNAEQGIQGQPAAPVDAEANQQDPNY
jgi:hypothetical protein